MKRAFSKIVVRAILFSLGILALSAVFYVFGYIFWRGKDVVSLSFILDSPSGMPIGTAGGIYPAIIGSISLGAFSALIGGVFGILTAIYITFYT